MEKQARYLFRGKRVDNGEWIIGNRIDDGRTGQTFIHAFGNSVNESIKVGEEGCLRFVAYEVDPSTICQCTGFRDVWENDIVRVVDKDGFEYVLQVVWDASETDFKATNGKENYGGNFAYFSCCEKVEVIGNAFDNPEYVTKLGPTYSEYDFDYLKDIGFSEEEINALCDSRDMEELEKE